MCAVISTPIKAGEFTLEDVSNAEGVDSRFLSRNASDLYQLLSDPSNRREVDPSRLNKPLSGPLRKKLKLSKQVTNMKAEELGMSQELLGRKKFLVELLRSYERDGELQWSGDFAGWRRELLEVELTAIITKAD